MNCRPGIRAMIVDGTEDDGRIVEVIERAPAEIELCWDARPGWHVASLGGPIHVHDSEPCHQAWILDALLHPLSDDRGSAVDEIRELAPHELEGVAIWP